MILLSSSLKIEKFTEILYHINIVQEWEITLILSRCVISIVTLSEAKAE